jgi:hypothetical protein
MPTLTQSAVSKPSRAKIGRKFGASLMSDTKWRKLFAALRAPDLDIRQAIVKFIDSDAERQVLMSAVRPHGAYVDTLEFGPFALREIEWVEFPRVAEFSRSAPNRTGKIAPKIVVQDIAKARAILEEIGQFPIEQTKRGIRIVGHIRTQSLNDLGRA